MSDASAIEWTDATWNPVRGCTKVTPGCKNCYAERFAERFRGVPGHAFEQGFDVRLVPEALDLPLRWKRQAYVVQLRAGYDLEVLARRLAGALYLWPCSVARPRQELLEAQAPARAREG